MTPLKLLAAAALAVVTFGPASAATITFDTFVSTNGADKLSPVVTVTEHGSLFDVSVSQTGGLTGLCCMDRVKVSDPLSPGTVSRQAA